MANVFVEEATLTAIGDAIRGKTGGTDLMLPSDMPAAIEGIDVGGNGGYDEGYAAGQADYENDWWETYQANGTREAYSLAFGGAGWTDESFKPKYNFNLVSGNGIAAYMMFRESKITDLSNYSFKFWNGQYMFSNMKSLKKIGDIYVTSAGNLYGAFDTCQLLEEINSIHFDMTNGNFVSCFTKCAELVSINTITGTIKGAKTTNSGYNHLNLSACTKLNKSTITQFMQALDDTELEAKYTAKKITFSPVSINKAFETSEGANDGLTSAEWLGLVASKPTWTIIT